MLRRNSSVLPRSCSSLKLLYLGFERVDALDQRHDSLEFALVTGAENFGNKSVDQCYGSLTPESDFV